MCQYSFRQSRNFPSFIIPEGSLLCVRHETGGRPELHRYSSYVRILLIYASYVNPLSVSGYYTILYYTVLYYTVLYYTILYCTVLYYTILYYIILYYIILYCTVLYYTILYYTILYYTIHNGTESIFRS